VQIAKALGAHVTGVCSARNVDLVRSLGADRVIDYTRDDFTQGGQPYDLILDNVSNHSLLAIRRVLAPRGAYVMVGGAGGALLGPLAGWLRARAVARFVSQTLVAFMADVTKADLLFLGELIEAGKVRPVIDRCYPLAEAAEAIRYLEAGHARGKVVVTV
jgi:NADPH:quinone reductase-like Zn-dependent oxidoreductase